MMKFTVAIFAGLFVLALAVAHAEESKPAPKPAAKPATKPVSSAPKELKSEDTVEGKGKVAAKGKTIKVNYTGWLFDPKSAKNRGKQFDTSIGKEPFTFTLGAGSVIKGWDEGFNNMKVGGKRVLTIPADMAYGARGAGDVIPPNAALVFEVELLDVMETSTN